ncbi:GTR11 protein, partial [Cercotrichas coryphoeus]|nr:GTR11 protein [Cercotrichas coryphoeus]
VKGGKAKHGSNPRAAHSCRKKCLLLNDLVLITATLHTGFSRRAKAFEMILAGRFLEGIAAGRAPTIPWWC